MMSSEAKQNNVLILHNGRSGSCVVGPLLLSVILFFFSFGTESLYKLNC
jgi:hypothetical protein